MVLATANDRDFFNTILPNVADPEIARDRIEAEAPRFTKSICPDFRPCLRSANKRVVRRNGVTQPGISVIHINAQHFGKVDGQIVPMPVRILLRAGVSHADVKKAVRTKCDASTAVVKRRADQRPYTARWLAGVRAKIRLKLPLHDDRGNLAVFEDLVFEIVFAVFAESWMKGEPKQPVRTAFIEYLFRYIREQCFHFIRRELFEHPDFSRL